MYQLYGQFQVNKTREEYITILRHYYPDNKDINQMKYNQLRAIYINTMNRKIGVKNG